MRTERFFTTEMGARLREMRRRRGLSQDQVAARLGLSGEGRWNQVARLEQGRNPNPSLRLVAQFLRVCGARWHELADLLEAVDVPAIPEVASRGRGRVKADAAAVRKAQEETQAYATTTAYPRRGPVPAPEQQRRATQAYQASRLQGNIVRQSVKESLSRLNLPMVHQAIYQKIGDMLLGAMRKAANADASRREQELAKVFDYAREQQLDMAIVEQVKDTVVRTFVGYRKRLPARA